MNQGQWKKSHWDDTEEPSLCVPGKAWGHWILGAAIVAGCAVATVITAGGFGFAMTAFGFAAMGVTVGGATGVCAMATVGSGLAFAACATAAVFNSNSAQDFADQGNWGTVATVATGGFVGGASGYLPSKGTSSTSNNVPNPNGKKGGTAHQMEILNQTAKYDPSQVRYEVKINTPGGMKPYRYADFSVTENGTTWYGNVGRQLLSGDPCARERYALSDIRGAGEIIYFFPYN